MLIAAIAALCLGCAGKMTFVLWLMCLSQPPESVNKQVVLGTKASLSASPRFRATAQQ